MRTTTLTGALALTAAVSIASAEPVILNGDMNGGIGMATAPTDWMVGQATPDVVNASGPFNNTGTPWTESPNGGTFARMNGVGNFQSESITQNVSGFEVGQMYELSFYATNLGFENAFNGVFEGFDGYFEFYVDGKLMANSDALSTQGSGDIPIVWTHQSVMFEALATDFLLEIRAETVGGEFQIAYMGIDGINAALVPAPSALAMMGLMGLSATRRKR